MLLLGLFCLGIVGPLRGVLAPFPALLFLASFALFMIPGALLSGFIRDQGLSGGARIPVAFVFSVGIFGLPGVPLLLLHRSTNEYLLLCGVILAASLLILALRMLREAAEDGAESTGSLGARLSVYWPWVPFLGLAGVLAYASVTRSYALEEDIWAYLANVRDHLNAGSLAYYNPYFGGEFTSFSRMMINGWLLEQAALARVSGIDPVEMTFGYLSPALVVLSLLAVYALAKTLIGNETGALLTGCLLAVLYLVSLKSSMSEALLAPGGEFIGRVTEDKYVARFVFVPVALALAVLALKTRSPRYLLLFAFVCPSVAAVHPLGLVFIGLPVAGLGLFHLLFNLRDRGAWRYVGGLGLPLLVMVGLPAVYLMASGNRLAGALEAMSPRVSDTLVQGLSYYDQIMYRGEWYVVDPVLLGNPAVLAAYAIGVPFLLSRARRKSPAGQLLLGTLLLVPIVCFVPPIASPIAGVIGPWILPRLAWAIPLAAALVLGWLLWEALVYSRARLEASSFQEAHTAGLLLAPALVAVTLVAIVPFAAAQVVSADESGEVPQEEVSCSDPVFAWMDDGLPASSTVLAPDAESSCIMARASSADILGYRKQKIGPSEFRVILQRFFDSSTLDSEMVRALQYYEVDYIMLPVDHQLDMQAKHRPASFTGVEIPGDRYALYEVDLSSLESDALITANDQLVAGDFDAAAYSYEEALDQAQQTGDEDTLVLSYLGLGQSYTGQRLPEEALPYFEQVAALDPEDATAHVLLSRARETARDVDGARAATERAVELNPRNVEQRARLAELAKKTGDGEAVLAQYRTIVEMFPEVPRYRAELGNALLLAGEEDAAMEQFDEAISQNPLSPEVHADVGDALQNAGRLLGAAERYERAIELEPKSQLYHFKLGSAYALLATANGGDADYFEDAEEALKQAISLEPTPGLSDVKGSAYLALGDLYYAWGREEEAGAAYETLLQIDPRSQEARDRLQELRR